MVKKEGEVFIHILWLVVAVAVFVGSGFYYGEKIDEIKKSFLKENEGAAKMEVIAEKSGGQDFDGRKEAESGVKGEIWKEFSGSPFVSFKDIEYVSGGEKIKLLNGEVMKDALTGFVWSARTDKPMDNNFSNLENKIKGGNAVGFCDELARRKYAGVSSWKLPTQKQLMQAYIDGSSSLTDSSSYFWSGTEFFGDSKRAWVVNLLAGDVASSPKENTASNFVKCVAETK